LDTGGNVGWGRGEIPPTRSEQPGIAENNGGGKSVEYFKEFARVAKEDTGEAACELALSRDQRINNTKNEGGSPVRAMWGERQEKAPKNEGGVANLELKRT